MKNHRTGSKKNCLEESVIKLNIFVFLHSSIFYTYAFWGKDYLLNS